MTYTDVKRLKKNGKFRKISMPDAELAAYQRGRLEELTTIFKRKEKVAKIIGVVHGFVPGRNVITAARRHIGYKATIMMDITDFFDTVTKPMVKTIPKIDKLLHEQGYPAQGFPTSPMVANIAVIGMIRKVKILVDKVPNAVMSWYADDIQISTHTIDKRKLNKIIKDVTKIIEDSGFLINENKTRIKYAKFGWRRILGVNVGETEVRATRKTMRKLRAARHQSNTRSINGLDNWKDCKLPKEIS